MTVTLALLDAFYFVPYEIVADLQEVYANLLFLAKVAMIFVFK